MIPPRSAIPVFRPTTATSGFVGHDFTVCFKTTNRGHSLYGAGLSPTTYCVQNKRKLSFDTDSSGGPSLRRPEGGSLAFSVEFPMCDNSRRESYPPAAPGTPQIQAQAPGLV